MKLKLLIWVVGSLTFSQSAQGWLTSGDLRREIGNAGAAISDGFKSSGIPQTLTDIAGALTGRTSQERAHNQNLIAAQQVTVQQHVWLNEGLNLLEAKQKSVQITASAMGVSVDAMNHYLNISFAFYANNFRSCIEGASDRASAASCLVELNDFLTHYEPF